MSTIQPTNSASLNNPLYHNTLKLLKNYRDVIWSVEASVFQAKLSFQKEMGASIDEFLDMAYCAGSSIGDSKVESYIQTIEQSRSMLKIIDASVETLRTKHKYGQKYYWILYYSYLSPQQFSYTDDIIDAVHEHCVDISRRSFYRYRTDAIHHLSTVLWGYTSPDCINLLNCFSSQS